MSAQTRYPLISVILPVYQGEATVMKAVRSVLRQSYPHLELIIVDDGSTDDTLSLLGRITDKRVQLYTQENQGAATARNTALQYAKGTYIAFIDSDDVWFPDKLKHEIAVVRKVNVPVCLVYSWYYAVDEANRLINLSPPHRMRGNIFNDVMRKESVLLPSTTLFHRQVFEKLGGFPTHRFHEDRTFSIMASKYFPAYPTQKRLVIYRQSLSGKCRRVLKDYQQAVDAEYSIINALRDLLSVNELRELVDLETRNLFYRFLMYNFVDSARRIYRQVNPHTLGSGKKAVLAQASISSGVNMLYYARLTVQFSIRYLLSPWWRVKSRSLLQPDRMNPHVRL